MNVDIQSTNLSIPFLLMERYYIKSCTVTLQCHECNKVVDYRKATVVQTE